MTITTKIRILVCVYQCIIMVVPHLRNSKKIICNKIIYNNGSHSFYKIKKIICNKIICNKIIYNNGSHSSQKLKKNYM